MQKFEETLNTLRNVGKELRDRGIVLEHLDKAIEQLNSVSFQDPLVQ